MVVLTGKGYSKDLSLTIGSDKNLYCSWVSFDRFESRLMWRALPVDYLTDERLYDWKEYRGDDVSRVKEVAEASIPALPVIKEIAGKTYIFWIDYQSGRGKLSLFPLSGETEKITIIATDEEASCREFSILSTNSRSGEMGMTALAAVEERFPDHIRIGLFTFSDGIWQEFDKIEGLYLYHPRLVCSGRIVLLIWSEYQSARYSVGYRFMELSPENGAVDVPAPAASGVISGGGDNLVFPTAVYSPCGKWFLACTADQPRLGKSGSVIHHSELKTYYWNPGESSWRESGLIDIDYGLNPWQAAYCGRRRQPLLLADSCGSTWLLWEMKQDPRSMDPQPGRLLGAQLDRHSSYEQHCFVEGHSSFVSAEDNCGRDEWLIASKTRFKKGELDLPYILHRISPGEDTPLIEFPVWGDGEKNTPVVSSLPVHSPKGSYADWHLYYGDPHCHSSWSLDLEGEPEEIYSFSRDTAGLDFVALTENDYMYLTEPLAPDIRYKIEEESNYYNEPGRFTTFNGYEYTKHSEPDSHRCVLFEGTLGPVFSWYDDTPTPEQLAVKYKRMQERVLLHPHHAFSLDITDDTIERNVEICSGWANHMLDPEYLERLHLLLSSGMKIGFIGGSDNHERNPGLGGAITGVWAASNSREGIFEALWNHRSFVTTGLRANIIFTVEDRKHTAFIGERIEVEGFPRIRAEIACCREIGSVELICNGEKIAVQYFGRKTAVFEYEDTETEKGDNYYYLHILFTGREEKLYFNEAPAFGIHGWTSPIWVRRS
jgi:hypothetical protein